MRAGREQALPAAGRPAGSDPETVARVPCANGAAHRVLRGARAARPCERRWDVGAGRRADRGGGGGDGVILRKKPEELEKMRRAGRVVGETLAVLKAAVKPGVTTGQLDQIAEKEIRGKGAIPAFNGA